MDKHFTTRNVNLSLLSEWVEAFFKKKEFRTTKEAAEGGFKIVARPTYVHEIVDVITVLVSGTPNDYTVKFYIGVRSEALMRIGQLASLFGLGVLFLRGVKSDEAGERLEKDFWVLIEEKTDFLAGSAKPKSPANIV